MAKKLEMKTGKFDARYESVFGDVAEIIEVARRSAARSVPACACPHADRYRTALPDEKTQADEIRRSQEILEKHRRLPPPPGKKGRNNK